MPLAMESAIGCLRVCQLRMMISTLECDDKSALMRYDGNKPTRREMRRLLHGLVIFARHDFKQSRQSSAMRLKEINGFGYLAIAKASVSAAAAQRRAD